jgi:CRP-like cAMP-binding protein
MRSNHYRNRVLKLLAPTELERLSPALEPVRLEFKEALYEQDTPITHLYFLDSGVVSMVTDSDGQTVETGTVGREGMVGLSAFFGMPNANGRTFCQIPGEGHRLSAEDFHAEMGRGSSLERILLRYANALMSMLSRGAACNAAHSLEQRMCRWLLMTHDRVDTDDFPLTQEFLALMLGVRRPTVSLAGSVLQRAGLIKYSRGRIAILDRKGLEQSSCECYAVVRKHFETALGTP